MSYTEICDKFEMVTQHLKEGGQMLTALCTFFKGFKRASDTYSQQVQKLTESLTGVAGREATMDTLTNAIMAFAGHFKMLSSAYSQFGASLQLDIYEPLELFLEHFVNTNASCTTQGLAIIRQLRKAQDAVGKLQGKYFRASEAVEKTGEEKPMKQVIYLKSAASKAMKDYIDGIQEANTKWDDYESTLPGLMEQLQQSEESRINFMKLSLEKYVKHHEIILKDLSSFSSDISALLGNINSSIDVRVFVDVNKSGTQTERESFVSYENWRDAQDVIEEFIVLEENPDQILVCNIIEQLGESSEIADYSKLSELMHSAEGRGLFVDALESRKHKSYLASEPMMQLAALTKSMLTAMVMEEQPDPYAFCKIVALARTFFTEEAGRRKYLSAYLNNHSVWTDPAKWLSAIEFAVRAKSLADRESIKRSNSQKKRGFISTLRHFANRIPSVFQKDPAFLRAEKTAAYMITSQFNFHMVYLGLKPELASEVVLAIAHNVGLDFERTCNLLAELQANQKNMTQIQTVDKISITRRHKKYKKWANFLPFVLALDFLDISDMKNLLFINKEFYSLKNTVLKRLLMRRKDLRTECWRCMLFKQNIDYNSLVREMNENSHTIAELGEVIDMDISRSYRNNKDMNPQVLKNILKSFAYYNREVGYCQGMNYLAGTLFIQFKDEGLTFRCLVGLVERFRMKELLVSSLPKLKQFFYQLDRLIAMELPEIHEAFKEVGICAGHFSSSWFITIFAITLQTHIEPLLDLWDLFIAQGWKVVFKAALAILDRLSLDITTGTFDDIMFLFGSLNQPAMLARVFDDGFVKVVEQMHVTNSALKDLEEEYQRLQVKASSLDI